MRKLAALLILMFSSVLPVVAQDGVTEGMLIVAPDLYNRAVEALQAEDYEQAILDSSVVILLNPTYFRAYYVRAVSYQSLEQTDSALVDLAAAIEHAPDPEFEGQMHLVRAEIYAAEESWDAVLEDYGAAIGLTPDAPGVYYMRASVFMQLERFEDALTDFNHVIELAPRAYEAVVGRAQAQTELGNFEEALSDYNALIELDPQNPQLYLARGTVYSESGSDAEAGADFYEWLFSSRPQINQDYQVVIGQSIELELQQGLVYAVPFEATEGQVINVEATGEPGAPIDPLIVLVQFAEEAPPTPLAGDDDSGGDFNAAILDYTIPTDGLYAVLVGYSGGGSEGSVVLKLAAGGE